MFGFGKKTTVTTPAGRDLSQLPFTEALLKTSLGIRQTLYEQLNQTGIKANDPFEPEPVQLDRRIGLAIQIVPPHIVRQTVEALGRTADFFPQPGQQLPKDAPAFMVFARVASLSLYGGVNREGFSLPLAPFITDLHTSVFYGWSPAEINATLDITNELYDEVMGTKTPEISEWLTDCSMIVTRYVEHYANAPKDVVKGCSILVTQLARTIRY